MQLREIFEVPSATGWIEILVLTAIFYAIFRLLKETRGAAILSGMLIIYGLLYAITTITHLSILNWLLSRLMLYLSLAFIVIFQPEIRRMLAQIGKQSLWRPRNATSQLSLVEPITQAAQVLSKRKLGALIAIERDIGTRTFQDSGTLLDSSVTAELLATIFFPQTPLHDGGVIISRGRIQAAGCLFPLSQKQELSKTLGTRHRAAIGIAEETDAIVVVVSEETGAISVAYNGRLKQELSDKRLRRVLSSMLRREHTGLARFREKINENEERLASTSLMNFTEERDEK